MVFLWVWRQFNSSWLSTGCLLNKLKRREVAKHNSNGQGSDSSQGTAAHREHVHVCVFKSKFLFYCWVVLIMYSFIHLDDLNLSVRWHGEVRLSTNHTQTENKPSLLWWWKTNSEAPVIAYTFLIFHLSLLIHLCPTHVPHTLTPQMSSYPVLNVSANESPPKRRARGKETVTLLPCKTPWYQSLTYICRHNLSRFGPAVKASCVWSHGAPAWIPLSLFRIKSQGKYQNC